MKEQIKPALSLVEGDKERLQKSKGKFIRVKQVAELLGVSVPSVWRIMRANPAFPRCFKFSQKITVWDETEIIRFVQSSRLTEV